MNLYKKRQRVNQLLIVFALIIFVSSLIYTNYLVKKLATEEENKISLWAKSIEQIANISISDEINPIILDISQSNTTIPAIVVDKDKNIYSSINLDTSKLDNNQYLKNELELMKKNNDKIVISLPDKSKQFVYYNNSILLTQLFYYPIMQLAIMFVFIIIAYLAFNSSRRAEQNQVWIGMSKETAHQLGTPISSIVAWIEILKDKTDNSILKEMKADINRLETITERFSKIGSQPKLIEQNINEIITNNINYLRKRTSQKVEYILSFESEKNISPVDKYLIEWVIENICKNAIDAIKNKGQIKIKIETIKNKVFIDISDNGCGIAKNKFKTIFKPGYSSKKYGWGLGLSLSKRIIEQYHKGEIFVKESSVKKGTSFRIILNK